MSTINLRFDVSGSCSQEIELIEDCPLTQEEIVDGLNGQGGHTVATTVQQGGELVWLKEGGEWIVLGKAVDSNMDAEYTEFEAE